MPRTETFSVIDVPFHNTRRHYRSIAHLKDSGVWKYDPVPDSKAAGFPNRAANYNPINGEGRAPKNVLSKSPQLKFLPDFLRNTYEVPYNH